MAVEQLVELLLLPPKIRSLNPVIDNLFIINYIVLKDENKEKEAGKKNIPYSLQIDSSQWLLRTYIS